MSFENFRRGYTEALNSVDKQFAHSLEKHADGKAEGLVDGVNDFILWLHREADYLRAKEEESKDKYTIEVLAWKGQDNDLDSLFDIFNRGGM